MKRSWKAWVAGVVVAVGLGSPWAFAALGGSGNSAECCQLTTALVNEATRGKDVLGDERFFMKDGVPPNVHFLVDTSCSMREFPQVQGSDHYSFFAAGDGCTNSRFLLLQAAKGWDPNASYPPVDPDLPQSFVESSIYRYMYWEDRNEPEASFTDIPAACASLHATTSAAYADCTQCLQTRGFYKKPGIPVPATVGVWKSDGFLFTGKFLNFNPPKYAQLKVALKTIVREAKGVRLGFSTFDAGSNGATLQRAQAPACDEIQDDPNAFEAYQRDYLAQIDGLAFTTNTPLAESLFNIGQLFLSSDSVYSSTFGFGSGWLKSSFSNPGAPNGNRTWCWACQRSAVVVLTDGEPTQDGNIPVDAIRRLNGGPVTCPDTSPRDGIPDCPDDAQYKLDDVAKLLYTQPVQGQSNLPTLRTFAVGFGLSSELLRNTATVGGGRYYEAQDASQLREAVLEILESVDRSATTFAAASVSSFQAGSTGQAVLPRMTPNTPDRPWEGRLYRFEIGHEWAGVCTPNGEGDLNHDGDCLDSVLVDREGKGVGEDPEKGDFYRYKNDGTLDTLSQQGRAVPLWEAGERLAAPAARPRWETRNIWTIVDSDQNQRLDREDTPIEFDVQHAAQLREALGIADHPRACADIAQRLGLGEEMDPVECARVVIKFYRGADAFNPNPAMRDRDRESLLGDIFHSAPVVVEPPASKLECGVTGQCLETLFGTNTPGGNEGYDAYVSARGGRDRLVVVGANDGMLHAFYDSRRDGEDPLTGLPKFDANPDGPPGGTPGPGDELWAFVPPNVLPKMRLKAGQHAYFVDGAPMVRDVWLDGAAGSPQDGQKQADEFRTIAVVGMGSGGPHRFALDLTELIPPVTRASGVALGRGDFLWLWPQPCDPLALEVGDSEGQFAPRPPPIGAVALRDASGPLNVGGVPARETWVALFNGGFDRQLGRGRGLAMVSLLDGSTIWSAFYGDGGPRTDAMRYPFAATPAMLDVGNATNAFPDADLLFDTATVADYGGQVWTARFWVPGELSRGKVTNWQVARSLEAGDANPAQLREPFTQMTTNAVQADTGFVRTYLGTGDRFNLGEPNGPVCRLSDPLACARLGCGVTTRLTVERSAGTPEVIAGSRFANQALSRVQSQHSGPTNACGETTVRLEWDVSSSAQCSVSERGAVEYQCGGEGHRCVSTRDQWVTVSQPAQPRAESPHRFYGFWSYGVNPVRRFNDASEAESYDNLRLRDVDLVNVSGLANQPATGSPAGPLARGWYVSYGEVRERTASGNLAVLPDETTATGATIADGCVLWRTLAPDLSANSCEAGGSDSISRLYQADFVTGAADCASGFLRSSSAATQALSRFVQSRSQAVPSDPAELRMLVGGMSATGVVTVEPGAVRGDSVSQGREVLQSVYQIELDQGGHDCRFSGRGCK